MKAIKEAFLEASIEEKMFSIGAIILLLCSSFVRLIQIPNGLPHYSIDENDIVEFALGYYGGDLNPHWFKYGPLYSYFLAAIYWVISTIQGTDIHLFIENYFEDPTLFYVTSRAFNALIHTGLAFVAFQIGRTFFSLKVGLIAFILAIIPLVDGLTNYTTRVDSLLALFMSLSLYFSLWMAKDVKNVKWYILAGAMLGFAIATKPLQAIVMMPSIYVAYVAGRYEQLRSESQKKKRSKQPNVFSIIFGSLIERRLYILLGATLGALFIGHPYLFLDFEAFWRDTFTAITGDTQAPWQKGYELNRFRGSLGWIIVGSVALSLGYQWFSSTRKFRSEVLVILTYISVYWLIFAFIPARNYFYVVLIPAIAVLLAMTIIDVSVRVQSKQNQSLVTYTLTLLLLASPLWFGLQRTATSIGHNSNNQVHALDAAEAWIDQNIEPNEQILYYGYYTSLPKIIDPNPNEQAIYGDYFMYQRGNNEYWIERFSQFMSSIPSRAIKTYDIIYQIGFQVGEEQKNFYLRYEMGEDEQFLYPYVSQSGITYVVTHYDVQKYPQFQQSLAWSSRGKGLPGGDVFIYEIP